MRNWLDFGTIGSVVTAREEGGESHPALATPVQELTGAGDTVPGDASTTVSLAIGSSISGFVNAPGDDDWFRVELVAGQSYAFTSVGSGGSPVEDPYLELYTNGGVLVSRDDDGGTGRTSLIRFTAEYSGTYYINARAWEDEDEGATLTGGYTLTAALGPLQDPLDTLELGFIASNPANLTVYFATTGQTVGDETALRNWTDAERAAVMSALGTFEAFANVNFVETGTQAGATFQLALAEIPGNTLAYFSGGSNGGVVIADPTVTGWTEGLVQGGLSYATLIHEFGHSLGLAHPHDSSGVSETMTGVTSPFNDPGPYGLNWGVFTTMSYNDGWVNGVPAYNWGVQGTPGPLDIALLQQKYGANTTTGAGDTVYQVPTTTGVGTFYQTIWDVSGVDTISYSGTASVTIDLRPATLVSEEGGGGYVSFANGITGGLLIAAGVVIENAIGGSGNSLIYGNEAVNRLQGGTGGNQLAGFGGNDILIGGALSDSLDGGTGADYMEGGEGDDWYGVDSVSDVIIEAGSSTADWVVSTVSYTLGANLDNLQLMGSANLNGAGNELNNRMSGNAGNNILDGGAGADWMEGGFGNDTYYVDDFGDYVTDWDGHDVVYSSVTFGLGTALDDLYLTGPAAIGYGNELANLMVGTAGANELYGWAGNDTLRGGAGADILDGSDDFDTVDYTGSNAAVTLRLWNQTASGGHATGDTLANFEAAIGSSFNDFLIGSSGGNVLQGAAGLDYLDGMEGDDTLNGGDGDDQLLGGAGADRIEGGAGVDLANFAASNAGITLRLWNGVGQGGHAQGDLVTGVENVIGSAFNDILIGAADANRIEGGAGADYLDGLAGNDLLNGGAGADTLIGGDGFDTADFTGSSAGVTIRLWNQTVTGGHATGDTLSGFEAAIGSAFADFLIGASNANTLRGAAGADYLDGMEGDDTLFGDDGEDIFVGGAGADRIDGGAGIDTANYAGSNVGITLRLWNGVGQNGHAQGDLLTGVENVTGSAFNDILIGAADANRIEGAVGADYLDGLAGNDILNGGAGGDQLLGGDGFDIADYTGSSAGVTVRLWNQSATGGDALGDALSGIEGLNGSSFADFLIGASNANIMRGAGGVDYLDGMEGDDTLYGDDGDDTLIGGAGADRIEGGAGVDVVNYAGSNAGITLRLWNGIGQAGHALGDLVTGVENIVGSAFNDILIGAADVNRLDGGAGADYLDGMAGADTLNGGAGNDQMVGGAGADTFVFSVAAGAANADVITDFAADDFIALSRGVFSGLSAGTTLAASAFVVGAAAADADDRIIYNSSTGQLFYDADGVGGAAQALIATLTGAPSLAAGDFVIVP